MNCLHYAALHGYVEIARTLLDAGAHIDAVNHVSKSHSLLSSLPNKQSRFVELYKSTKQLCKDQCCCGVCAYGEISLVLSESRFAAVLLWTL